MYLIYIDVECHGLGAGKGLLDSVVKPTESASLWCADQNLRALAFYEKHGFRPDGHQKAEAGIAEIRLIRKATEVDSL